MKFNEEKLQRLNVGVKLGFANLRTLAYSARQIRADIQKLAGEIHAHPINVRRRDLERQRRPIEAFRDDLVASLQQLEQRLARLKAKLAQVQKSYDGLHQEQAARARLLENSVRLLRDRGIEVSLLDAGDISDGIAESLMQGAGPVRDFLTGKVVSPAAPPVPLESAASYTRRIVLGKGQR